MKITKLQLRKIIKEQLLNEVLPGPDGLGTDVDAYVASIKVDPNNPEKWDREVLPTDLSEEAAKEMIRQLKPYIKGSKSMMTVVGDIIKYPFELRAHLTSDGYQAYAPDAKSQTNPGEPISQEERNAAKDRLKTQSLPNIGIEGLLTVAGFKVADKLSDVFRARKARKAKKGKKFKKQTGGSFNTGRGSFIEPGVEQI